MASRNMYPIDIEARLDTVALNEAPDWETWGRELDKIVEACREVGLDEAAAAHLGGIIAESAQADDGVQIFLYGYQTQHPTSPSGYGNYWYWKRAGNAWFGDTVKCVGVDEEGSEVYETWVRIALVSPRRLAFEIAPDLETVLNEVDDFLSDRAGRPTQSKLRRRVRKALGK